MLLEAVDFVFDSGLHERVAEEEEDETPAPIANIGSIDNKGKIAITFSEVMQWPDNFAEMINDASKRAQEAPKRKL